MCRLLPVQSFVANCFYAFASFFFGSSSLQADMQISPGSVSGIEINTSLLSAVEKEVYQTAISVCSTKTSKDLYISFSNYPYDFEEFSVKNDASGIRQEYHFSAELNGVKIALVKHNEPYKFNIQNVCDSADRDDMTLGLTFYGLGKLQPGTYSGQLWVHSSVSGKILEIPITLTGASEVVKISNLDDLTFHENGNRWVATNNRICVYSSVSSYRLEARSSNRGMVKNSRGEGVAYSAFWIVGKGSRHDLTKHLSSSAGVVEDLLADNSEDCPTVTSTFRASVPAVSINNLPAGTYSDIITLTVMPG